MHVAEVDVELVYTDEGWSPYLTVDDAERLDEAREALRTGDLDGASRYGQVYIFTAVASQKRYAWDMFMNAVGETALPSNIDSSLAIN